MVNLINLGLDFPNFDGSETWEEFLQKFVFITGVDMAMCNTWPTSEYEAVFDALSNCFTGEALRYMCHEIPRPAFFDLELFCSLMVDRFSSEKSKLSSVQLQCNTNRVDKWETSRAMKVCGESLANLVFWEDSSEKECSDIHSITNQCRTVEQSDHNRIYICLDKPANAERSYSLSVNEGAQGRLSHSVIDQDELGILDISCKVIGSHCYNMSKKIGQHEFHGMYRIQNVQKNRRMLWNGGMSKLRRTKVGGLHGNVDHVEMIDLGLQDDVHVGVRLLTVGEVVENQVTLGALLNQGN